MIEEDFEQDDIGGFFDFKGFLFKLLRFWPLFIISLGIAFGIARYINVRKIPIYQSSNMISIKDDQNPLFTGNTSLTFNWGGTTDKVATNITLFKSRTHTEKVVSYLQFYINYLQVIYLVKCVLWHSRAKRLLPKINGEVVYLH